MSVNQSYNTFLNTFKGMESLLSGEREEVPKVAPPIQGQGQAPPQGYGYNQQPQYPPQNYGYPPPNYGYPPPQYGYMPNPFVQPKMEFSEDLLTYHAKQMIKRMKQEDKLISTIPKEIFRAAYDRKADKVMIADFERSKRSRSEVIEGSDLEKAYHRQSMVVKLIAIINKKEDESEDEYLELIANEQFKMEKEMGILKLPSLQEYWKSRRTGMFVDYSEFITDTVKGVAQEFGGGAVDFFTTIKQMILGG